MKQSGQFSNSLRRLLRDDGGATMMTYVVFAVLLVAAIVAAVIVFGGRQRSSLEVAGHAAGGALTAAEKTAEAATENFEVAMARAMETGEAIQGGEFALAEGGKSESGGGNDRKSTANTKKDRKHKINHPVWVGIGHTVLDVGGFIPGVGEAVDLLNAAWYAKDGQTLDAVLTASGAITGVGDLAKFGKWGKNIAHGIKVAKDSKFFKILSKSDKVANDSTKVGRKIATDTTTTTGKTGEKVVEKTTGKADVIKIERKTKLEKTGTGDVVQREEVTWRKVDDTKVEPNKTIYDSTEIGGNGSQNGNNPFANYNNNTGYNGEPVSGVNKVEPINKDTHANKSQIPKSDKEPTVPKENNGKVVKMPEDGTNTTKPGTGNKLDTKDKPWNTKNPDNNVIPFPKRPQP